MSKETVSTLKQKGVMDGDKIKMKPFETETKGEYSKRADLKNGGCMQIKGWGKARKR